MHYGKIQKNNGILTRRDFLKCASLAMIGSVALPKELIAKTSIASLFESRDYKSLKLYNVNTSERLNITYFENGMYIADGLMEINKIMADRRSGEIIKMDKELIELLYKVQTISESHEPINIISAYRSPNTNQKMHDKERGVAQNSYHTRGMAIDINIQNRSLKDIRKIAKELQMGGVGYYPRSNFVHVDVGPVRTW